MMDSSKLSTDELERHLVWQRQVLTHLVRDFGKKGEQSQLYRETAGRIEYLETTIAQRASSPL
jgi:hypothetical protein